MLTPVGILGYTVHIQFEHHLSFSASKFKYIAAFYIPLDSGDFMLTAETRLSILNIWAQEELLCSHSDIPAWSNYSTHKAMKL